MLKKLYISLIVSNFVVSNQHGYLSLVMHNLYANFVRILERCKDFSKDLVNERGNLPRRGVVPRFSDLEVKTQPTSAFLRGLFQQQQPAAFGCDAKRRPPIGQPPLMQVSRGG